MKVSRSTKKMKGKYGGLEGVRISDIINIAGLRESKTPRDLAITVTGAYSFWKWDMRDKVLCMTVSGGKRVTILMIQRYEQQSIEKNVLLLPSLARNSHANGNIYWYTERMARWTLTVIFRSVRVASYHPEADTIKTSSAWIAAAGSPPGQSKYIHEGAYCHLAHLAQFWKARYLLNKWAQAEQ